MTRTARLQTIRLVEALERADLVRDRSGSLSVAHRLVVVRMPIARVDLYHVGYRQQIEQTGSVLKNDSRRPVLVIWRQRRRDTDFHRRAPMSKRRSRSSITFLNVVSGLLQRAFQRSSLGVCHQSSETMTSASSLTTVSYHNRREIRSFRSFVIDRIRHRTCIVGCRS